MLLHLIRLARPKQWLKNGIVILALVFAGEAHRLPQVERALLALVVFCLLSSAMYVFNDLLDREKDRRHPLKKNRPLASGAITPPVAVIYGLLLLGGGLAGATLLNPAFVVAAVAFLAVNTAYSLALKNVVIIDAMTIAISFVIRAYAGAIAVEVPASKWLIIVTLLLALFLAFGKRRHELVLLEEGAIAHRRILGEYSPYLLDQCIGVTTASVVVMYMLYSFSSEVAQKLGTEDLYLTIPFVVYGIFRYLYLIHKREEGGSPTSVLINDRPILLTVILWLLTAVAILYFL